MGTNVIVLLGTILIQDIPADKPVENPAILQIRVLEGEGVAYPLGGRATRGVTVQVTDETGRPVEGSSVSFRLPDEGPSGIFANGSRSEISTTRADGKAAAWGMQWNHTEGSFEIRITAAKGAARAGTICAIYLSKQTATAAAAEGGSPVKFTRSHKWLWITLAAAGAAVAVVAVTALSKSSTPIGPTVTPTTIGLPSIVLGQP